MRRGWDMYVDFGLRHPAFYLLMFGTDRLARRPTETTLLRDWLHQLAP